MHVLRRCDPPCPLYRNGLPDTASKSTSIRAKLLYSTSLHTHALSDEEMVDLHLGNGQLRIQSRPVRLLGATINRLLNFGTHASTAAKQTMLRRYQLKLVARAGASHLTMRSFSIGYVHSVSLYRGEAILPCLAYNYLHNMEVRYRDGSKTFLA
ncbi:hypothetical protein TcCL_Unassigned01574 [Trypanosoma cruzi]|nr:hypothetical protein TcCL_Unassigned01574 [Trypanosoma cruzi]